MCASTARLAVRPHPVSFHPVSVIRISVREGDWMHICLLHISRETERDMDICIHTQTHTHTHVHPHTYTHTNTHTHTHTPCPSREEEMVSDSTSYRKNGSSTVVVCTKSQNSAQVKSWWWFMIHKTADSWEFLPFRGTPRRHAHHLPNKRVNFSI